MEESLKKINMGVYTATVYMAKNRFPEEQIIHGKKYYQELTKKLVEECGEKIKQIFKEYRES